MSDTPDWVLKTDVDGFTRHFAAEALPVTIGGDPRADIRLAQDRKPHCRRLSDAA